MMTKAVLETVEYLSLPLFYQLFSAMEVIIGCVSGEDRDSSGEWEPMLTLHRDGFISLADAYNNFPDPGFLN